MHAAPDRHVVSVLTQDLPSLNDILLSHPCNKHIGRRQTCKCAAMTQIHALSAGLDAHSGLGGLPKEQNVGFLPEPVLKPAKVGLAYRAERR